MALRDKYQSVLDLGNDLGVKEGYVREEDGQLKIGGTVETQREKDILWDRIKEVNGGNMPHDMVADIEVSNKNFYAKHTVEKGDSLSKIAKEYYGDPMKYKSIFEANRSILDDPNKIFPGQELVIPNKDVA